MKTVLCLMLPWVPSALAQAQVAAAEIVVLTVSTKAFEQLTTNVFSDQEPEWARDGTRILFDSDRAGTNDL